MIEVKWCGFDFGQCIMEPTNLRNPLMLGDIFKELGEPEKIEQAIRKSRILKEKYGDYGIIKEAHVDEILSYVLDGNEEAMRLFFVKQAELVEHGEGLRETLTYLQNEHININIVSELKKTLGPVTTNTVTMFLKKNNLTHFFNELITPQGKINLKDYSVDDRYKGLTKESGKIYDKLKEDLLRKDIKPSEAVIVGDKPTTDIIPAKKRGFHTIQYTGYIDYGEAGADYRISSFLELPKLVKGKVNNDE